MANVTAAEWTLFNEADMVAHFDPAAVVAWARQADPSRLLDTNSGGPANSLGVGDVNDTHDCPLPTYNLVASRFHLSRSPASA